jgi:hypothetical protein
MVVITHDVDRKHLMPTTEQQTQLRKLCTANKTDITIYERSFEDYNKAIIIEQYKKKRRRVEKPVEDAYISKQPRIACSSCLSTQCSPERKASFKQFGTCTFYVSQTNWRPFN